MKFNIDELVPHEIEPTLPPEVEKQKQEALSKIHEIQSRHQRQCLEECRIPLDVIAMITELYPKRIILARREHKS